MSNYILGLHISHDATASLINEHGEVVAAVAEERVTRVKYHVGFPYRSIEEVIRMAGIGKKDISAVAVATRHLLFPDTADYNHMLTTDNLDEIRDNDFFNTPFKDKKWDKLFSLALGQFASDKDEKDSGDFRNKSVEVTKNTLREILNRIGLEHASLETYDHHHCHATSVYYSSGITDPLLITMDGAGDGLCASASIIENGKVKCISGASDSISPGRFYSEITGFGGFKRLRHEGKITGLAAYGDANKYYTELRRWIRFNPATEQFEYDRVERSTISQKFTTLKRILEGKNAGIVHTVEFSEWLQDNFNKEKDLMDLAAAAQRILEELAVEYVQHFRKKYPKSDILLAGGVFANVRVNQFVAEIEGVKFVNIHQNMGDGGIALGAAYCYLYETLAKAYTGYKPKNVYYGNSYTNEEIKAELDRYGLKAEFVEDIEKRCAELMHEGKVIGRFHGRMEYGPRALGNRSIIARTTEKGINDWLNKKLKRTEFMPFAPSMLGDEAGTLLEKYERGVSNYADNFMTITYNVKPEWQDRMQAATHVDGTARPQVVFEENNPSYYKIIKEYYKLSGIPSIINTSFNMHEEPIVCTPDDAIRSFNQGCLDYLAIENWLVKYEG